MTEQTQKSVTECLMEISNQLNKIYELIKSQESLDNRQMTILEFAKALGLSVYKLKAIYSANTLAIAEPKRTNGVEPKYTLEDLNYMKDFLSKHKV